MATEPGTESGTLGPLIGLRRPRYEILHDVLGGFFESEQGEGDLFLFVNLGAALRHLFSEYGVAQLTRGEMSRRPRELAAELVNLAGHYRHYAWRFFKRRTTVLLYHSSGHCPVKLALHAGYKAAFYSKRVDPPSGEYEAVRRYVDFNLRVAALLFAHLPNMHLVDTGELDPEAWPWALMEEGRVDGPALVMSSWDSDLQYVNAPGGHGRAVLRANGEHSCFVCPGNLLAYALRDAKTGEALAAALAPGHFPYLLALAGDVDLGVPGIPRFGLARAAKLVAERAASGRLPPDHPGLQALLEDGRLSPDHFANVGRAWGLLIHRDYAAAEATPARMAALDAAMVNRSGLAELERANSAFFGAYPLSLDMAFAGEEY